MYWLNENRDALQTLAAWAGVLVALGGVIVGIRYVRLTRRLAETSLRQANVMQSTFEALHRPYLRVALDWNLSYYYRPDFFLAAFGVKNHGPLPAIITGWHIAVREQGRAVAETDEDAARGLFPTEEMSFEFRGTASGEMQRQPQGAEFGCVVRYRGFHATSYTTRIVATTDAEGRWQYTTTEID